MPKIAPYCLVKVKLLTPTAKMPVYASEGAAGADLHADLGNCKSLIINPGEICLVKTGIAIQLEPFTEAQIRPRSGLALKNGITVLNSPGTIDADYRGEIGVILYNAGRDSFVINHGDRIAQMVIAPVIRPVLVDSDLLEESQRGEGGFGSTGTS